MKREKTTGRKYYLSESQIQKLETICVHYHKNLSEMVGKAIEFTYDEMTKEKAETNFKEQLNAMEFITSITQQVSRLENIQAELNEKLEAYNKQQTNRTAFIEHKLRSSKETNIKILSILKNTKKADLLNFSSQFADVKFKPSEELEKEFKETVKTLEK